MFFFMINKSKSFFSVYNNRAYIKKVLYYSFVVGLLLAPGRLTFAFLASQLALSWLIIIFSLLLIIISLLLRAGLENKPAVISLKAFCLPLFIILFIWLMLYFNFIGGESAIYVSCLTALPDWDEIGYKMESFLSPSVNNGQMALAGGAGSEGIKLEKGINKLIPSSLLMEGESSGSRKRPYPDTDSGTAGPSKKAKVTVLPPSTGNFNVPPKLYTLKGLSIISSFPEAKTYRGVEGYNLAVDKKGFEYIPCPKVEGPHQIGSSGFISYKPDRAIDKATIWDPECLFLRGWCSDGSQSNQPTASRVADVLLAAKANGQSDLSNSMFDVPLVKEFVMAAGGNISDYLSYRLIIALRLSK